MSRATAVTTPRWVIAIGVADLAVLLVMLWTFPDKFEAVGAWLSLSMMFGSFACSCALLKWAAGRYGGRLSTVDRPDEPSGR